MTASSDTLRELQVQFERDTDAEAAAAKLIELRKRAAEGDVELPRASQLVTRMFDLVHDHLVAEQQVVAFGMGAKYKSWLRALPADVAAVIAMWECIHLCTLAGVHSGGSIRPVLVQDLAINIASKWETEVRVREAEAVNPVYMKRIHDQVKENCTRNTRHLHTLYNVAYDRVMKGELDSVLQKTDLVQVGKFGVNACLEAGLIEQHRTVGKSGTLIHFTLAEEIFEFLTGYDTKDVMRVTDRQAGAMQCVPDAWTTLSDGGYLTARRKISFPLLQLREIRASERQRIREAFTAEKMPMVFDVANYLQSQAFAVHGPTLEAIKRVWVAGGGVLGVPTKAGPQKPKCPLPEDWSKDSGSDQEKLTFTMWKRDATMYYTEHRKWRSKVREIAGFLNSSSRYGSAIYFPVYVDKRCRWYYRGTPNPQGSDLAKSVLHFHNKKPLGAMGVFWLKVHIANSFGFDKERFEDRARWTEQHWEALERALDAPEDYPEVLGEDAPWCVFSAAWELREAYRSGDPHSYKTGQIVHMDATCSGLQHFSAMLRDPVGGACVNLSDEAQCGPKQDIYSKVAANALEAIRRDLDSDSEDTRAIAAWWLSVGISRDLAKKPVMTYVYGATLRGTAQHIEMHVHTKMPGVHWPDEHRSFEYSQYAARKLFQGIAATVPAAAAAMHWLRDVAQSQPNGKRMEWTTPTGFKVQHDYLGYDEVRVAIRSCGINRTLVRNPNDKTNPRQMQNAIAPNFVHALDATHLTFTAQAMLHSNLNMVGIHDSFGTHACDVPSMHRHIREQFVSLYSGRNVLSEFLWDIGMLGEAPMRGSLNINDVLSSEFFFC